MRLLLIFNPNAHSGRAGRQLPAIRDALIARSMAFEILETSGKGHGVELVANADLSGFDAVVAVGGDGTVFEVLNGLYSHTEDRRKPMGLIPMGTGNAFAREFDLMPANWNAAVDLLAAGRVRNVDVGRVVCGDDRFHFLNIIGMGFAVDAGLAAKQLKFLGNSAYTIGTLWRMLRLSHYPLVIECDGKTIEQDNVFVEVSNSRYTGTKFLIAPSARIDDGLLDLVLLKKLSRFRLLRLFPTIYSGRHVEFEEVDTLQVRQVSIRSPADMVLAPDGEFRGRTPVEIECLHRDLALIC